MFSLGWRRRYFLLGGTLLVLLITTPARPAPTPAHQSGGLAEASRWLQGYLRLDTTNPPGNEAIAAQYLQTILEREGIPTRRWTSSKGRVNLAARLSSSVVNGPTLILL